MSSECKRQEPTEFQANLKWFFESFSSVGFLSRSHTPSSPTMTSAKEEKNKNRSIDRSISPDKIFLPDR